MVVNTTKWIPKGINHMKITLNGFSGEDNLLAQDLNMELYTWNGLVAMSIVLRMRMRRRGRSRGLGGSGGRNRLREANGWGLRVGGNTLKGSVVLITSVLGLFTHFPRVLQIELETDISLDLVWSVEELWERRVNGRWTNSGLLGMTGRGRGHHSLEMRDWEGVEAAKTGVAIPNSSVTWLAAGTALLDLSHQKVLMRDNWGPNPVPWTRVFLMTWHPPVPVASYIIIKMCFHFHSHSILQYNVNLFTFKNLFVAINFNFGKKLLLRWM